MKILYSIILSFIFITTALSVETNKLSKTELAQLIEELPHAFSLSKDKALLRNPPPKEEPKVHESTDPKTGKKRSITIQPKDLVGRAQKNIEKAQRIIPILRNSITEGSSIFDYPGLLSKVSIRYYQHSDEYRLYMGYNSGSIVPCDFQIIIDNSGTILAVEKVVWTK